MRKTVLPGNSKPFKKTLKQSHNIRMTQLSNNNYSDKISKNKYFSSKKVKL